MISQRLVVASPTLRVLAKCVLSAAPNSLSLVAASRVPLMLGSSFFSSSSSACPSFAPCRTSLPKFLPNPPSSFLPSAPKRSLMMMAARKGQGRRKKADNDQPTRRVKAYCTADSYNLDELTKHLSKKHVTTYLSDNTLHIRKELPESNGEATSDIFFFKDGCIVAWGSTHEEEQRLLELVKDFEIDPNEVQMEEMEWVFGQQSVLKYGSILVISEDTDDRDRMHHQLAFSWGLVHSVKLSVLEEMAEKALGRMKDIPQELAKEGELQLSHREIHQRMGDFLTLQGQLNSTTLETPDMYWEQPELEGLFKTISRDLEIYSRHNKLGQRLDYGNQLMEVLRTLTSEKHFSRLEKVIIVLIATEILLNIRSEIEGAVRNVLNALGFSSSSSSSSSSSGSHGHGHGHHGSGSSTSSSSSPSSPPDTTSIFGTATSSRREEEEEKKKKLAGSR